MVLLALQHGAALSVQHGGAQLASPLHVRTTWRPGGEHFRCETAPLFQPRRFRFRLLFRLGRRQVWRRGLRGLPPSAAAIRRHPRRGGTRGGPGGRGRGLGVGGGARGLVPVPGGRWRSARRALREGRPQGWALQGEASPQPQPSSRRFEAELSNLICSSLIRV